MPGELTAYLAAEGFEQELRDELGKVKSVHGRLMVAEGPARPAAWAQNVWLDPREVPIKSIADGTKRLRELAPRWALFSTAHHRRAQLIQEKIPRLKSDPIEFLSPLPKFAPASWTLLEPDLMLASPRCTSLYPNGVIEFKQNKSAPPSRAYLKLWELFTVHGVRPKKGERVVDLGSSPGGWTWVLQSIGCEVLSVDKAPLDPRIAKLPRVESIKKDAFTLKPEDVGPLDWLFSDIICDPKRLYELVQEWRASGLCRNFACTLKFKGATDHKTSREFSEIPGSRLFHQYNNKHELTWVNLAGD